VLIKEAEIERVGSIYHSFSHYISDFHKTIASYKTIIRNVCTELDQKVDYKKNLEAMLILYFEDYAKVHRHFHEKTIKIPKEEETVSVNKFANMKEELKRGFFEFH
jgi:DNA mismatch repair ATPase MutS